MPTTTTIQALPVMTGTDAADIPAHVLTLAQAIEKKLVMTFASATARDTAIAAPVEGMRAYLLDLNRSFVHDGTAWTLVEPLVPPRAHGYAGSLQNHNTNGQWERVYLSHEAYDTDAMLAPASTNSRITCNTSGLYAVNAQVFFAVDVDGGRMLKVKKNSNGDPDAGTELGLARCTSPGSIGAVVSTSFDVVLAANEYVEMFAWQNSGGQLAFGTTGEFQTFLQLRWISA